MLACLTSMMMMMVLTWGCQGEAIVSILIRKNAAAQMLKSLSF
jgi:hypothetical protein